MTGRDEMKLAGTVTREQAEARARHDLERALGLINHGAYPQDVCRGLTGHDWIDMTASHDQSRLFICGHCSARREEPF